MSLPIQIPTPCHEDWQQMIPADKGRHCLACQKTVIDFTQMTDAEIVSFFKQKPAGVCGRFRQEQLTPKPVIEPNKLPRWKMYFLAISATIAMKTMLAETVKAQKPVEQREPQPERLMVEKVVHTPANETLTVSGRVIEAETNEAIPGASVAIKGTNRGTTTDVNGKFQLPVVKRGDTLVISFIGYIVEEHKVQSEQPSTILMAPDTAALSDMVVVGYASSPTRVWTGGIEYKRVSLHKRIFYAIKSWFQ